MKKQDQTTLTTDELYGVNQALGWLTGIEVDKIGVEMLWDSVTASKMIRPSVESVQDIIDRLNQEYYTEKDQNGNLQVPESRKEEFAKAKAELYAKTFSFDLPKFSKEKIQGLPGFTGIRALQLFPLLVS